MSILFKTVAKGQPGVVGGGTPKYYATIVRKDPLTLKQFASDLADRSTLTRTDIIAVLESFIERFPRYLKEGRIIHCGSIGSFWPSISSNGELEPDDVDQLSVRKVKVIFRPSMELKNLLESTQFRKVDNGSFNNTSSIESDVE